MKFEDLDVWQASRRLVSEIYQMTRVEPLARDYGLCSQIQRAAVSVMTNIAEGFERSHRQEKIQFYNIARASAAEVRSLLYVIQDNYPKQSSLVEERRADCILIARLISGLIRSTTARKH